MTMLEKLQAYYKFTPEEMETVKHGFNDGDIENRVETLSNIYYVSTYEIRAVLLAVGFEDPDELENQILLIANM